MDFGTLLWSRLSARAGHTALSVLLFGLSVGIISLLLLLRHQVAVQLERNVRGIDLVVGAKGSRVQLLLSAVYHVDVPTGNISLADGRVVSNNRLVEWAIPLALGDSYREYPIVGTDHRYLQLYEARLGEGDWFWHDMEAVLGSEVARATGLKVGDTFVGSHGLGGAVSHAHDGHVYRVVGVLKNSGSVLDAIVLTTVESVWLVHEHDNEVANEGGEGGHEHEHEHEHGHGHGHNHDRPLVFEYKPDVHEGREVTAYLVRYKPPGTMATTVIPKIMAEQFPALGYANPAVELQRLNNMTGVGVEALSALAYLIMVVSGLSVFIALYTSLRERRYEMAVMRVMGASRRRIFALVWLEGGLIAVLGTVLGWGLGHGGMWLLASELEAAYRYRLSGWVLLPQELWLLPVAVSVGLLAALVPAWQGYRTALSATLGQG